MSSMKHRIAVAMVGVASLGFFLLPSGTPIVDPDFHPTVAAPAYPDAQGRRVVIAIDETHANGHTLGGMFGGFAQLLTEDGAIVEAFATPYVAADCTPQSTNPCGFLEALAEIDVLVIANAGQTISAAEAQAIRAWVLFGGSLLLIADHDPWHTHVVELASALGLEWKQTTGMGFDYFSAAEGTLDDEHPVVLGRSANEAVPEVLTFRNSVFTATTPLANQRSIMTFPPGWTYTNTSGTHSAAGMSAGMAFTLGFGRVFAATDGAMWTAQLFPYGGLHPIQVVLRECPGEEEMSLGECIEQVCSEQGAACVMEHFCTKGWTQFACFRHIWELAASESFPDNPLAPGRVGMQMTYHGQQLVLNVIHWLDGLL